MSWWGWVGLAWAEVATVALLLWTADRYERAEQVRAADAGEQSSRQQPDLRA